jgi:hypothetical protein
MITVSRESYAIVTHERNAIDQYRNGRGDEQRSSHSRTMGEANDQHRTDAPWMSDATSGCDHAGAAGMK